LQAIPALDALSLDGDEQVGVDIVRKALEAPARQIADNAGARGEVVVDQVRGMKAGHGYDALKGEYGDLFKKGIVDAAKVTRSALQNAASIAAMVLTTLPAATTATAEGWTSSPIARHATNHEEPGPAARALRSAAPCLPVRDRTRIGSSQATAPSSPGSGPPLPRPSDSATRRTLIPRDPS
jgi:hypothetical protein